MESVSVHENNNIVEGDEHDDINIGDSPAGRDWTSLPDEILIDIFNRLPAAKDVARSRFACKSWELLTSTDYFDELYPRTYASITVLVETRHGHGHHDDDAMDVDIDIDNIQERTLCCFDGWRGIRSTHTRPGLEEYVVPALEFRSRHIVDDGDPEETSMRRRGMWFSAYGLLVFQHGKVREYDGAYISQCLIRNPLTRDKVKINLPPPPNRKITSYTGAVIWGQVCGLFFHPVLKELCVIWGQIRRRGPYGQHVNEFKWVNLGPSPPRWRNIILGAYLESNCNLLKDNIIRRVTNNIITSPPVAVDDFVYWMLADGLSLLVFDIKKEKLISRYMFEPTRGGNLFKMNIVVDDDDDHPVLAYFVDFDRLDNKLFEIWIYQKDDQCPSSSSSNYSCNWSWQKRYSGDLPFPTAAFGNLRAIACDGELLLLHSCVQTASLIVQNLERATGHLFPITKDDDVEEEYTAGDYDGAFIRYAPLTYTFLPIRNSMPEILVDPY